MKKELIDKKVKALRILRENEVLTYLDLIIKPYKMRDLYCYSIKNRKNEVATKPNFANHSYTINTDSIENVNLQISLGETHVNSWSYLDCLVFENDNLVLEFSVEKEVYEVPSYSLNTDFSIQLKTAKLSKTWFACLKVIYDRIVELDSIEQDKKLRNAEKKLSDAEKKAKAELEKFDFGEFDK